MFAGLNVLRGDTDDAFVFDNLLASANGFERNLVSRRYGFFGHDTGRRQRFAAFNPGQGQGDIVTVVQGKDVWRRQCCEPDRWKRGRPRWPGCQHGFSPCGA